MDEQSPLGLISMFLGLRPGPREHPVSHTEGLDHTSRNALSTKKSVWSHRRSGSGRIAFPHSLDSNFVALSASTPPPTSRSPIKIHISSILSSPPNSPIKIFFLLVYYQVETACCNRLVMRRGNLRVGISRRHHMQPARVYVGTFRHRYGEISRNDRRYSSTCYGVHTYIQQQWVKKSVY